MKPIKILSKINFIYHSSKDRNYIEILEIFENYLRDIVHFSSADEADDFVMALAGLEENETYMKLSKEEFCTRVLDVCVRLGVMKMWLRAGAQRRSKTFIGFIL